MEKEKSVKRNEVGEQKEEGRKKSSGGWIGWLAQTSLPPTTFPMFVPFFSL